MGIERNFIKYHDWNNKCSMNVICDDIDAVAADCSDGGDDGIIWTFDSLNTDIYFCFSFSSSYRNGF